MEKIHEFLIQNEWIDCGYGDYLSKDREFHIYVGYDEDENKFIVRSAITKFFDRWTNSESEIYISTYDEVITYLKAQYIIDAFGEITTILEDSIDPVCKVIDEDAYKIIVKIIENVSEYFNRQRISDAT